MNKTPIELLQKELDNYREAYEKSVECLNLPDDHARKISDDVHLEHKHRLELLIADYDHAICVLKNSNVLSLPNITNVFRYKLRAYQKEKELVAQIYNQNLITVKFYLNHQDMLDSLINKHNQILQILDV
jgi:hypothetical protein